MCSMNDDPTTYSDPDEQSLNEEGWDQPTDANLEARFASLGDPVDPMDVPTLIRAGVEVWSYGYDADDPELFTTLDESDLWAFEDPDFPVVSEWGPFRADAAAVARVIR